MVSAAQLWSLQKALFDTWMHELRLKDGEGKRGCLLGRIEDQPQIQGLSVGAAALSALLFLWSWVMHTTGSQAGWEGACSQGTLAEARTFVFHTAGHIPVFLKPQDRP